MQMHAKCIVQVPNLNKFSSKLHYIELLYCKSKFSWVWKGSTWVKYL